MIPELVKLFLVTLIPGLELRAGIPYGFVLFGKEHWFLVFIVCVVANIFLGIAVYYFVRYLLKYFLHFTWFARLYEKIVLRAEKKMRSHFKHFRAYEALGLALFIAVPLPGSGVYTGAVIASLLKMRWKDFAFACVVGVFIAGTLVTAVSYTGTGLLEMLF